MTTLRLLPVTLATLLLFFCAGVSGQPCASPSTLNMTLTPPQNLQWVRTLGGSASETGYAITAVSDTTVVITGITFSPDGDMSGGPAGDNGFVAKYHTNGTLIWKKILGGPLNEGLNSVVKADNGSIIVSGASPSIPGATPGNHGSDDVWLTKLDVDGNIIWQKMFGGSDAEYSGIIRRFGDNKFVVLSYTASHDGDVINPYPAAASYPWLFVINEQGNILSQKVLSDTIASFFHDIQVTADKGFILAGEKVKLDPITLLAHCGQLVKTDSTGAIIFSKTIYTPQSNQVIFSVAANADSSFTFTGQFNGDENVIPGCLGNHSNTEIWTGKVDKAGDLLWQKYYGGSEQDYSFNIINAAGGGHFIAGTSASNDGNVTGLHEGTGPDAWIIKLDKYGNLEWQKTVGGTNEDFLFGLTQLPGSEIIVTGYSASVDGDVASNQGELDMLVFKIGNLNPVCTTPNTVNTTLTPPEGLQWLRTLGGSDSEVGYSTTAVSDTTFVVTGYTSSADGDMTGGPANRNGFVAKYHRDGTLIWKKVMGGPQGDMLESVVSADNGSVIVSGHSRQIPGASPANHGDEDVWLAKLDVNGNVLWQKMLGGSDYEAHDCIIRKFGNDKYVVLSMTYSRDGDVANPYPYNGFDEYYPWLFIINKDGDILSQKVFPYGIFTEINDIQVTLDKGFIIGGVLTVHNDDVGDYVELAKLVKTDSTGNILFNRSFSSPNYVQWIQGITVNADSSFTFAGELMDAGAPNGCIGNRAGIDVWVGKANKYGDLLWQKFYGGTNEDEAYNIVRAAGGGYIISGQTSSNDGNVTGHHPTTFSSLDAWAIQLDENGNLQWQKTIGGNGEDRLAGLLQLPDNEIIFVGTTNTFNNGDITGSKGNEDVLVFRIDAIVADRQFCPGGNNTLYAVGQGTTYQWQVDTGSGFINVTDDIHHSGSATSVLQLLSLPSNWYGYRYRCLVNGIGDPEIKVVFTNTWTGAIGNDWHVAGNWSCGSIPDEYTDVRIFSGTPVINANATIRSLQITSGAVLTVSPGVVLTVLH